MRRKIIAGNWKMNCTVPETEALIGELLESITARDGVITLVCPPYTSLARAGQLIENTAIALGAQNMSRHQSGAYTGEISAEMLLTLGVRYVILGHSERRQYHAEDDPLVNAKVRIALAAGLTPIICVGEIIEEREAGQTESVVRRQLVGALAGLSADDIAKTIVAYEPVWAIGTGQTATPETAQTVHALIRSTIAGINAKTADVVPILYGGSVKPSNAKDLLEQPDIDGALVGGASLKATDFVQIVNAA